MNNLIRTLTESSLKPPTDLRLLLSTLKEGRKQAVDAKLSDPFYDALDGLLSDLKAITLDNRDAEAFLKPVSKTEVPDYYDVIANPMDFQTMHKKVKQKQYKSKREFKDDLELIWSNCYLYNASENHPLRQCVKRLKTKADRLLKHITDRRDRTDPPIPLELGAHHTGIHPKLNGVSAGTSRAHTRSPSYSSSTTTRARAEIGAGGGTGTITPGSAKSTTVPGSATAAVNGGVAVALSRSRLELPFPETPAIMRTSEGMRLFYELDQEVNGAMRKSSRELVRKLKELAPVMEGGGSPGSGGGEEEEEEEGEGSAQGRGRLVSPEDADEEQGREDSMDVDGVVGDKRKLRLPHDRRPRKRARFITPYPAPLSFPFSSSPEKDEISELWWAAAQSDTLLANGVPPIPFSPSSSRQRGKSSDNNKHKKSLNGSETTKVRRQKLTTDRKPPPSPPTENTNTNPNTLLNVMNNNIKTMRRIRHTHAKFAALNATTLANEDQAAAEEGAGAGTAVPGAAAAGGGGSGGGSSSGMVGAPSAAAAEGVGASADDEILNEKVDERPWMMTVQRRRKGKSIKGREEIAMARVGGIDIGEKNAWGCLQWANQKVLEHVGFQGTSQVALDVLVGVMAEYLSNVGRTIRYLCDKYPSSMTPEEIVLHTLFEGGAPRVQDLERYIRDDVERYGSRLNELEKKIVGAYRESTAGETLEDEGLFEDEDEEETGALAIGEFADLLGEDYLGLRELGIAAEFGMSSLSIPKKLLKTKKNQLKPAAVKPSEPPPPYPPPPPFIPLTSTKVDDQIGLLKTYYTNRFTALAAATAVAVPAGIPALAGPRIGLAGPVLTSPLPGPSLAGPQAAVPVPPLPPVLVGPSIGTAQVSGLPSTNSITVPGNAAGSSQPIDLASLPVLTLPDDAPGPVQAKMGPLGQIVKGGGAGSGAKKKSKGSGAGGGGAGTANPGNSAGGGGGGSSGTRAGSTGVAVDGSGAVRGGSSSPAKKKKGVTGVGTGNGRKKKGLEGTAAGPGAATSTGQGSSAYPPVVVASA